MDLPYSKLMGSEHDDELTIGRQMSVRLSHRLGIPVFLSCSLAQAPTMVLQGTEEGLVQHRAAALAEREIFRILKDKLAAREA